MKELTLTIKAKDWVGLEISSGEEIFVINFNENTDLYRTNSNYVLILIFHCYLTELLKFIFKFHFDSEDISISRKKCSNCETEFPNECKYLSDYAEVLKKENIISKDLWRFLAGDCISINAIRNKIAHNYHNFDQMEAEIKKMDAYKFITEGGYIPIDINMRWQGVTNEIEFLATQSTTNTNYCRRFRYNLILTLVLILIEYEKKTENRIIIKYEFSEKKSEHEYDKLQKLME